MLERLWPQVTLGVISSYSITAASVDMTWHLKSSKYEYKLEARIVGQGSYGQVRKASCDATQEAYACKTVKATGRHEGKAENVRESYL